jgi:hypothetical protein
MDYEYEVERYEDGDYRVRVLADTTGDSNPRDWDNVSVIVGMHSRYNIGDRKPDYEEMDALERGGVRLLKRFLQLSRGMIAFTLIGMYDHSGITIYPMSEPDQFRGVDTAWDHSTVGFAYITKEMFDEHSGGDPNEEIDATYGLLRFAGGVLLRGPDNEVGGKMQRAWANLYGELQDYDDYLTGNVHGFVVEKRETWHKDSDPDEERDEWEQVESCWGFIGEPEYAMAEGKATLESILATERKAVSA